VHCWGVEKVRLNIPKLSADKFVGRTGSFFIKSECVMFSRFHIATAVNCLLIACCLFTFYLLTECNKLCELIMPVFINICIANNHFERNWILC